MSGERWTQSFNLNPAGILVPTSLQPSTAATRVGTPAESHNEILARLLGAGISTAPDSPRSDGYSTMSPHVTVIPVRPLPTGERPAPTDDA